VRLGVSLADSLAGVHAFAGALLALRARDRAGQVAAPGESAVTGQVVDIALYESVFAHMESIVAEYDKLGAVRQPAGSALPGIVPSNVYRCRDGDWIVIGANQDSVFGRLAVLLGHPEWAQPGSAYATHTQRSGHAEELDAEISNWAEKQDADELLAMLAQAGIPGGRIFTAADIVHDAHYAARQMLVRVAEPSLEGEELLMQGVVPRLTGTPGSICGGAPLLGAHTEEVLRSVRSPHELARLREAAVI
jgi:formyl-CoA transferase/succinyl-CoA--D-citramalate CoA-transferase